METHALPDSHVTIQAILADRVSAYEFLSSRYASDEDGYHAVQAACAADLHTVQAVMWEHVVSVSPSPAETFDALAEAVTQTLAAHAPHATTSTSARGVVEAQRQTLLDAFEPAAADAIASAFIELGHLDALPAPDAEAGQYAASVRLGSEAAAVVAAKRRQSAHDAMTVARGFQAAGMGEDAMEQAWRADWAALEAFLLDSAAEAGDASLTTVELRWRLACEAVSTIKVLPPEFTAAVEAIRNKMATALGSAEGVLLRRYFADVSA